MTASGGARGSSALHLVATCTPGLEPILEAELLGLGAEGVEPGRSAVRFRGDWPAAWRANYWLRTANRVLIEIASFPAGTSEELYAGASGLLGVDETTSHARSSHQRAARAETADRRPAPSHRRTASLAGVALSELLSPAHTFAVSATSSGSRLRDTRWIALKVKDAIADAQRARFRRRADVDPRRPDVPLRVWLNDDRATVLLDSSREPLDRRGYREISGVAPLREPLAAAMVLATGWDGTGPVVDPMCGTGTLLIEAGWIALGRAPGSLRRGWAFERWPGFDPRVWARIREQRPPGASPDGAPALRLHGRDLSSDAIRAARRNVEAAGLTHLVDLATSDGFAFAPPPGPGLVLANPAYGERLETSDQEWRRIGDLLKQRYAGWRCALIAGEPGFGKQVGLKPKRRIPVKNGPLDARILLFDLYSGSARKPPL